MEYSDLDEVWFVVTPLNPHKKKKNLLEDYHRLAMVEMAIENYPKLVASDVEFRLPQPNYTVNTLVYIEEKYPRHKFCLIMGEDNLKSFHRWKNYEVILEHNPIYVYPRISEGIVESEFLEDPRIKKVEAPIVEISSTFIRNAIKEGKNTHPLLSEKVWHYIDKMHFYK